MNTKLEKLNLILKRYKRVLIAYSGGVDSTFLLVCAIQALGKQNVLAVTAVSETYPASELKTANKLSGKIGAEHIIIRSYELKNRKFRDNPVNRCFFCKNELFGKLSRIAKKNKMVLCDATNFSDRSDFRPGRLAAKKWKVKSPLFEARIMKDELRRLSRSLKLPNWNYPAQTCLASRLPYGTRISEDILRRVEKAEKYLRNKGFFVFRVRHHGDVARIEAGKNEMKNLFSIKNAALARYFKALGWRYVSVDIEGYRMGSLNPK
jgi:pyridinium-3,5-biscarboxylic acid mononucleotide sulfurtransferase